MPTDRSSGPLEAVLVDGHDEGLFSCAVAAIGDRDGIDRTIAVGESDPIAGVPATANTCFDVASITKPVVTTTVVLRLVEDGTLALDDALGDHLDGVVDDIRAAATIEQLMTHTAGFEPYHYDPDWNAPSTALSALLEADVVAHTPGETHEYSCLSYVHLAAIARAATGEPLVDLAERLVFEPVGMDDAHLGPLADPPEDTAVTYDHEYEDRPLKGEIHDPIARATDGQSGNAGLFTTADDLARYARMVLGGGAVADQRILSTGIVDTLGRNHNPDRAEPHGLGWRLAHDDWPAPGWSQHAGGAAAVGHTGYTGTSLWIDPPRDQFAVLLTNAVYENVSLGTFRERFHRVVAESA